MKTLAAEFTAELAAETATFAMLLDIELSTPLYRNTLDIPVTTGGNTYTPINMSIDRVTSQGGLAAGYIDTTIDTVDQLMAAAFLGEQVAGKGSLLSVAAIGSNYRVVQSSGSDVVVIASWELTEQDLKITFVNEMILWRKKTLRKCQVNCQWPFKSAECAYAGAATWCDQSYTRCTALGNTANYGGFRFIKATMEKEIRWGTY